MTSIKYKRQKMKEYSPLADTNITKHPPSDAIALYVLCCNNNVKV